MALPKGFYVLPFLRASIIGFFATEFQMNTNEINDNIQSITMPLISVVQSVSIMYEGTTGSPLSVTDRNDIIIFAI